jgi:hypothetical protein
MYTETEQAAGIENAATQPRRGRRIQLIVAIAALATLMMALAPVSPASASITQSYSSMRCGGGEVNVNMPQVTSTYQDSLLLTRAELYYRAANGGWYPYQDSGWWAYSVTGRSGTNGAWKNGNHAGVNWYSFSVVPGYTYAVRVSVGDLSDGDIKSVWAEHMTPWVADGYTCVG